MEESVAAVLVDSAADRVFDYAVPPDLVGQVAPGARVAVPLRGRRGRGTVLAVRPRSEADLPSGLALKPVAALLGTSPLLSQEMIDLARWTAAYYLSPLEPVLKVMAPATVRPEKNRARTRRMARLADPPPDEAAVEALRRRAPVQAGIVARLLAAGAPLPVSELGPSAALAAPVRALAAKGIVVIESEEHRRDPNADETIVPSQPPPPTAGQEAGVQAINQAIDRIDPRPVLLHGVTGSGKTEVYLRLIRRVLDRDQGAIVLVPEISLTPQTVERFLARFGGSGEGVAVLHSRLGEGERFDEWQRIARGEARVVVGPRSAVFAPVHNLGIIVVDEEHEGSYKQDNVPRYHARDLAVVRAHRAGCAVVLGSATPSLESWQNAAAGKYRLVSMAQRVDDRRLPLVRVVDMRIEARKHKDVAILSDPLRDGITKRLEAGEQVMLFLNRRGFSRALQCPGCGHVVECAHCSVSLTYHKTDDRLLCHVCGYRRRTPRACPACRDPGIRFAGFGTQRAEEVVRKVFPKARVARLDSDTTRGKGDLAHTLRAFRTGKIDILIGTQMIAKGLDFPNVTLVGVLNADIGLNMPDFRAGERTFQLLTQVAGRSGRGDREGEVVVQTFAPHSPAVQFARHHDFAGFAEQEMEFRRAFHYPPATHAILLTSRSEKEELARLTLEQFLRHLLAVLPPDAQAGGIVPAPLARREDEFRFQLLLRAPRVRPLAEAVRRTHTDHPPPPDVHLAIDVDCYQMG